MKIISQNDTSLVAEDTNTKNITFGAILLVVGTAVAGIGIKDELAIALAAGTAIALVGLFIILTSKKYHTVFDLTAQSITITTQSFIQAGTLTKSTTDVREVTLFEMLSPGNRSRNNTLSAPHVSYQTQLVFADGTTVPIEKLNRQPRISASVMGIEVPIHDQSRNVALTPAQTIAAFLNVPFNESGAGTVISKTFLGSA